MALIVLSEKQQEILAGFVRRRNSQQWLSNRAMIILQLNLGASIRATARQLRVSRNTVRTWYRRWKAEEDNLAATDKQDDQKFPLHQQIQTILSDSHRCGRPPIFSPEEIVQIVAIACQDPRQFNRPISHWTPRELADEVVKQGLVASVSARSVGRFLTGMQPSAASPALLASCQHRGRRRVSPTKQVNLSSLPASLSASGCRKPSDEH